MCFHIHSWIEVAPAMRICSDPNCRRMEVYTRVFGMYGWDKFDGTIDEWKADVVRMKLKGEKFEMERKTEEKKKQEYFESIFQINIVGGDAK